MIKFIIKNCPNCYSYGEHEYWCEFEHDNTLFTNPCKESDCLLKQIVELCKDAQDECSCKIRNYVKCFECTSGGRAALGKEILELLEIEECE